MSAGWAVMLCLLPGAAALQEQAATALAPKTASTRIQPNRPASSPIESGPNAATSHGLVSTPVNEEYSYGRRPLVAIWAILASLPSEPGSGPGE